MDKNLVGNRIFIQNITQKLLTNYKGGTYLFTEETNGYHLKQMIKVNVTNDETGWLCMTLGMMHKERQHHFCDTPKIHSTNLTMRKEHTNPM